MSAAIDLSNGRVNFAYTGSASAVWWRPPQANQLPEGATFDQWLHMSGLSHNVVKCDAYAEFNGEMRETGQYFNARSDNGAILSRSLSERFVNYQPADFLRSFFEHVLVNPEFTMSTAFTLEGGRRIGACASHKSIEIAGEAHQVFLNAVTSFDGSAATTYWFSVIRILCANTVAAALGDKSAMVKVYHNTKVDAANVVQRLAAIASSVERYKAAGDAMAQTLMAKEQVSALFRKLLNIPVEAKQEDISTRKANQYRDMWSAYQTTVSEGAPQRSAWAVWNAVTRYVDHDKDARNANASDAGEARFVSAQFGNGAKFKEEAFGLLMPLIKDKVAA